MMMEIVYRTSAAGVGIRMKDIQPPMTSANTPTAHGEKHVRMNPIVQMFVQVWVVLIELHHGWTRSVRSNVSSKSNVSMSSQLHAPTNHVSDINKRLSCMQEEMVIGK
jgi:hypothetical protein